MMVVKVFAVLRPHNSIDTQMKYFGGSLPEWTLLKQDQIYFIKIFIHIINVCRLRTCQKELLTNIFVK